MPYFAGPVADERGALRARATDESETIAAGLAFRAIGYRGIPLPGVSFDERAATILNERGRVLGWYVYYALPGEGCQLLQLAAHERHEGAVLDNLFTHAIAQGGAAVQGRVEGRILPELAHRGALFRFSPRSLIFSRNTDLLGAVTSGHALLTRLEGEWWMAT